MATGASAADTTVDNKAYIQTIEAQLRSIGLTDSNIKSLCNQGFSREKQLDMTIFELNKHLNGNMGKEAISISPRNNVSVTNVPDDIYGTGTETFLAGCGFVSGNFYNDNQGGVYKARIDAFANHVFNGVTSKRYYFLFGEYDSSLGYHKGVDLQAKDSTTIILRI